MAMSMARLLSSRSCPSSFPAVRLLQTDFDPIAVVVGQPSQIEQTCQHWKQLRIAVVGKFLAAHTDLHLDPALEVVENQTGESSH